MTDIDFLKQLEALVRSRLDETPEGSYTAKLAAGGILTAAQKVGEEGVELALAATVQSDDDVIAESADLLFHLLVVLAMRGITLDRVVQELRQRHRDREN